MNEFDALKFKEISRMIEDDLTYNPEEVEEMSKYALSKLTNIVEPNVDEMTHEDIKNYERYIDTVEELANSWVISEKNLLKHYRGEEI